MSHIREWTSQCMLHHQTMNNMVRELLFINILHKGDIWVAQLQNLVRAKMRKMIREYENQKMRISYILDILRFNL